MKDWDDELMKRVRYVYGYAPKPDISCATQGGTVKVLSKSKLQEIKSFVVSLSFVAAFSVAMIGAGMIILRLAGMEFMSSPLKFFLGFGAITAVSIGVFVYGVITGRL